MGYELNRFQDQVDEDLICVICGGVLQDPVMAGDCEHCFCRSCIEVWLNRQRTCPVDRGTLQSDDLKLAPRIIRNMLGRLKLTCENQHRGCESVVRLDQIQTHEEECDFNPTKPIQCTEGCGAVVPKDEMIHHSCIRELGAVVRRQNEEIKELLQFKNDATRLIADLSNEVTALKEFNRSLKLHTIPRQTVQQYLERDEIVSWTESLKRAKVARWGGVISTPDVVLQTVIKRALIDTSCPLTIVDDLMENAHERRWPVGLSTLESRQVHRHRYDEYVVRRIRGKQAVLIMHFENRHMGENLIVQPGMVIIFAHGIEDA